MGFKSAKTYYIFIGLFLNLSKSKKKHCFTNTTHFQQRNLVYEIHKYVMV